MCRNADKLYYPIKESILSVLPVVDEFVVAVGRGDGDDRTLEVIREIESPKIEIIETDWDIQTFPNGSVHAQQTDLAKSECSGDWLIYLQSDEVLHEDDARKIRELIAEHEHDERVDGFLFQYHHFWGTYANVVDSHGWYPKEIRIIRNKADIHSWQSAQSFRRIPQFDGIDYLSKSGTEKLRVIETDLRIFHYGWVRPPGLMVEKSKYLDEIHSKTSGRFDRGFDYGDLKLTRRFKGSHPTVMTQRIEQMDWDPRARVGEHRPLHKHERLKNRILTWIERNLLGGRELFGFKNYLKVN